MNFSLSYDKSFLPMIWVALVLVTACTTVPQKDVKHSGRGTAQSTPGTVNAPVVQAPSPSTPPAVASNVNEPVIQAGEISVGLILGPGGAKTLAEIGVLRELERAQIPVRAVVGIEWGALIGGLFASHGRSNDAEWQIAKLRPSDLPSGGRLFGGSIPPVSIEKVAGFLDQATVGRKASDGKIPFTCPFIDLENDIVQWVDQGSLKDAVTNCLPFPPVFETKNRAATPFSVRGAIRWLRQRGIQKVILVNVLPSGALTKDQNYSGGQAVELVWREIRNQTRLDKEGIDWTIDVSTKGYSFHEVENMRALILQGSKITASQIPALKKRLGL